MNYHDYRPYDMLNGLGVRSTLFVSGCIHGCSGCYNVETWDPESGKLFTKELADRVISDLKGEDGIRRRGLSLTGGDPLHISNRSEILDLIYRVKKECPGKDIWLWTGFTKEEIWSDVDTRMRYIAENVDYLIDGKFEKGKADPTLLHRGSSNQNVYKHLERII